MAMDPTSMNTGEKLVYIANEVSHIKSDVVELKEDFQADMVAVKACVQKRPEECRKIFVTEGKVFNILLKCLVGITALGGLIIAGVKLIPAAIVAFLT
jgi:hypothetical protein